MMKKPHLFVLKREKFEKTVRHYLISRKQSFSGELFLIDPTMKFWARNYFGSKKFMKTLSVRIDLL